MLNGSHVSNPSMIKCFEVISMCIYRKTELPHAHGPNKSVDARHVLSQREGGEEARDHCAQRVCAHLPQRRHPL